MEIKQYIVDAFTDHLFSGNPAAVCMLSQWLPEETMRQIAMENNLSETAFAVPIETGYHLRWFTPGNEVELCGHATLGTAFVVLHLLHPQWDQVAFQTRSGILAVKKEGNLLAMDLPSYALTQVPVTQAMEEAIGARPKAAYLGLDLVCVMETEQQVRLVSPNLEKVMQLEGEILHMTAQGSDFDCVTRSFAPKCAVAEDPVCGRGHCHVVPLWAKTLGKKEILAYQASKRGGVLHCQDAGERTVLRGNAVLFSEGILHL